MKNFVSKILIIALKILIIEPYAAEDRQKDFCHSPPKRQTANPPNSYDHYPSQSYAFEGSDESSGEEEKLCKQRVFSAGYYSSDDEDYGRNVIENLQRHTQQNQKKSKLLDHIVTKAGHSYGEKLRNLSDSDMIFSLENIITLSVSSCAQLLIADLNVRQVLDDNIQNVFRNILMVSKDFNIKNHIIGFYFEKQLSFFRDHFILNLGGLSREEWKLRQEKYTLIFEAFLTTIHAQKNTHEDGLFFYNEDHQNIALDYIEQNLKYLLTKYQERRLCALLESWNIRGSTTKEYYDDFSKTIKQKFYTLFFKRDGSKEKLNQLIIKYGDLMSESLQEKTTPINHVPQSLFSTFSYFTSSNPTSATEPELKLTATSSWWWS